MLAKISEDITSIIPENFDVKKTIATNLKIVFFLGCNSQFMYSKAST